MNGLVITCLCLFLYSLVVYVAGGCVNQDALISTIGLSISAGIAYERKKS